LLRKVYVFWLMLATSTTFQQRYWSKVMKIGKKICATKQARRELPKHDCLRTRPLEHG
jgi:hypothetical protein